MCDDYGIIDKYIRVVSTQNPSNSPTFHIVQDDYQTNCGLNITGNTDIHVISWSRVNYLYGFCSQCYRIEKNNRNKIKSFLWFVLNFILAVMTGVLMWHIFGDYDFAIISFLFMWLMLVLAQYFSGRM